jgi:hypothetical protein
MTPAEDLLAELAARGIAVAADGNRLRLRPRSTLSERLIRRLHAARGELLVLVRRLLRQATPPPMDPLQWWVLCALAQAQGLACGGLYGLLPAPRAAVDRALAEAARGTYDLSRFLLCVAKFWPKRPTQVHYSEP